jgi:hypothetical protein
MKRLVSIVKRFAPKLGAEMTQTLAYQFAQAFLDASFKYGRRKFILDCGAITLSEEPIIKALKAARRAR